MLELVVTHAPRPKVVGDKYHTTCSWNEIRGSCPLQQSSDKPALRLPKPPPTPQQHIDGKVEWRIKLSYLIKHLSLDESSSIFLALTARFRFVGVKAWPTVSRCVASTAVKVLWQLSRQVAPPARLNSFITTTVLSTQARAPKVLRYKHRASIIGSHYVVVLEKVRALLVGGPCCRSLSRAAPLQSCCVALNCGGIFSCGAAEKLFFMYI